MFICIPHWSLLKPIIIYTHPVADNLSIELWLLGNDVYIGKLKQFHMQFNTPYIPRHSAIKTMIIKVIGSLSLKFCHIIIIIYFYCHSWWNYIVAIIAKPPPWSTAIEFCSHTHGLDAHAQFLLCIDSIMRMDSCMQSLQPFNLYFILHTIVNPVLFKHFLYFQGYTLCTSIKRGGAGWLKIHNSALFIHKISFISVKLWINPYTCRHCAY